MTTTPPGFYRGNDRLRARQSPTPSAQASRRPRAGLAQALELHKVQKIGRFAPPSSISPGRLSEICKSADFLYSPTRRPRKWRARGHLPRLRKVHRQHPHLLLARIKGRRALASCGSSSAIWQLPHAQGSCRFAHLRDANSTNGTRKCKSARSCATGGALLGLFPLCCVTPPLFGFVRVVTPS